MTQDLKNAVQSINEQVQLWEALNPKPALEKSEVAWLAARSAFRAEIYHVWAATNPLLAQELSGIIRSSLNVYFERALLELERTGWKS
jgi:hypothetical protein